VKRMAWFALALALLASAPLYAQVAGSNLRGKVTTEDGQPVPGATVTVTNQKTGAAKSTTTDTDGGYRLAGLTPAPYNVSVTLPGFAESKSAVTLQIGQTASVNVTMRPQAVTGEVTVTAEAPLIEPTEHDLSTVINEDKIDNLPLAGRKWQDLALLAPGAAPGPGAFNGTFDPTKTRVGAISVGGNQGREVNVSIDGGDNNDDVVGGILMQFSADAIQEFEVVTEGYKAEYGKATNGLLNVVTKSGTNNLDGTAFGFFRNEKLRSLTPAQEEAGGAKPPFHITQFGATIGGPIVKDKTHFFGSYERLDEEQTFDISSSVIDEFGPGREGCVSSGGQFCVPETTVAQPFTQDLILGKIDHQLNDSQRLSLRVAFEFNKNASGDQLLRNSAPTNAASQYNHHTSILGSHTWTISPDALNEFKFQYSHFKNEILSVDSSLPTVVFPDATFGANTNTPQATIQTKFQFRDDLTYYSGNHTFKAGVEVVRVSELGGYFAFLSSGTFVYGADTRPLDQADYFYIYSGDSDLAHPFTQLSGYAQDDWEIAPNVTLNLGVRYDLDVNALKANPNQFTADLQRAFDAGQSPFHQGAVGDDKNNIAPRVGFAWDVGGKGETVVRGSYGHYFDQVFDNVILFNELESPKQTDCSQFTHLPGARNCGPFRFIYISPVDFGPSNIPNDPAHYPNASINPAIRPISPDMVYPFTRQVTLGGSHEFTKNVSMDVDLVLANTENNFKRRFVMQRDDITNDDQICTNIDLNGDGIPDPIGRTQIAESTGKSWYRAVQSSLKARWAKANILLTYVLGKAESTQADFNTRSVFADRPTDDFFEKGPAPGDIRHRAVLSATFVAPYDINIGTITQISSALPYTVTRGFMGTVVDRTKDCRTPGNCIPDFENGPPLRYDVNGDGRVDSDDRIGRGQLRGDSLFKLDLRLSKAFKFGEGYSVEVLGEVFNLTNAKNFGNNYQGDVRNAQFGQPTGQLVTTPREFQLGARVRF
jgi:carboxypeptidase family protein/TonB-dependent receptor-like protein